MEECPFYLYGAEALKRGKGTGGTVSPVLLSQGEALGASPPSLERERERESSSNAEAASCGVASRLPSRAWSAPPSPRMQLSRRAGSEDVRGGAQGRAGSAGPHRKREGVRG